MTINQSRKCQQEARPSQAITVLAVSGNRDFVKGLAGPLFAVSCLGGLNQEHQYGLRITIPMLVAANFSNSKRRCTLLS
jgi:hypothetical protein